MIKRILVIFIFISLFSFSISGQTNISGIINIYTSVLYFSSCNSIQVQSSVGYSAGDLVLLIQMQGAAVDSANNNSGFGRILNYNNCGNYEFGIILVVTGNTISFQSPIIRSYSIPGKVQLVRVPRFVNANVSGTLDCMAWNGSVGGVLALKVANNLTLNSDINISGKGFRGGQTIPNNVCPGCQNAPDYYYAIASGVVGQKGEGIFVNTNTNLAGGKGAIANGGGSGACKNAGGGGGANIGAGGLGGLSFNICSGASPIPSGIGGYILDSVQTLNKLFMGGGGGGGQEDNSPAVGTNGTAGGGIIIIDAETITGNSHQVVSNGAIPTIVAQFDGGGGGGAGGTIVLNAQNYLGNLILRSNGAKGSDNNSGNVSNYCHAPGGGGGGGLIWFSSSSTPAGVIPSVLKGDSGKILNNSAQCVGTSYGALGGKNGAIYYNHSSPFFVLQQINVSSNSVQCIGDTLQLFSSSISGTSFHWNGPNSFSSTLQNPIRLNLTIADTGDYIVQLFIDGCLIATDSVHVNFQPVSQPTITSNSPVCIGDTLWLTSNFISNAIYNWSGPNGFQSFMQNPEITNFSYSDTGNYSLMISINGCPSTPVSIYVSGSQLPPTIFTSSNSPLCDGDTLNLSASFYSGIDYSWTGPDNFHSVFYNPSIYNVTSAATGVYSLVVRMNSCLSIPYLVPVSVDTFSFPLSIHSESVVCNMDTIQLSTNFILGAQYLWTGPNNFSSTQQNPAILNASTINSGNYSLLVTASNGCRSGILSTDVAVIDIPTNFIVGDHAICEQGNLALQVTNSLLYNYFWTGPANYFSIDNPINISPVNSTHSGSYVLIASSACGIVSDTFHVDIIATSEYTILSNIFTPNSDSNNDTYSIDTVDNFEMNIYNRWGEKLALLNPLNRFWDGTYNNHQVPDGVYVYLFRGYDCQGELKTRRGSITIAR